jgi:hypothetical protein
MLANGKCCWAPAGDPEPCMPCPPQEPAPSHGALTKANNVDHERILSVTPLPPDLPTGQGRGNPPFPPNFNVADGGRWAPAGDPEPCMPCPPQGPAPSHGGLAIANIEIGGAGGRGFPRPWPAGGGRGEGGITSALAHGGGGHIRTDVQTCIFPSIYD